MRARFVPFGSSTALVLAAFGATGCEGIRSFATIAPDASSVSDASTDDAGAQDAATFPVGPVTGGPCASSTTGRTAFRVQWIDNHGTAVAKVEKIGLPDSAHFSAVGFSESGASPVYDDPYFGGGISIDSTNSVDISLSTRGLPRVRSARLAILARSFDTTDPSSFVWSTYVATGKTPAGSVSNGSPYEWTSADLTNKLSVDDSDELIRIQAGPPSLKLVIARVELCIDADDP